MNWKIAFILFVVSFGYSSGDARSDTSQIKEREKSAKNANSSEKPTSQPSYRLSERKMKADDKTSQEWVDVVIQQLIKLRDYDTLKDYESNRRFRSTLFNQILNNLKFARERSDNLTTCKTINYVYSYLLSNERQVTMIDRNYNRTTNLGIQIIDKCVSLLEVTE